jgi:ribonuclease D
MQGDGAMKVKVFSIRLRDEDREQDEAALNRFLEGTVVTQVFASVVQDRWSVLVYFDDTPPKEPEAKQPPVPLSAEERSVYEALMRWRNDKAQQEGIAPYMVAHNESLRQIVKLGVRTHDELLKVRGFRERRVRKYGDEILRILNGGTDNDKPLYLDF